MASNLSFSLKSAVFSEECTKLIHENFRFLQTLSRYTRMSKIQPNPSDEMEQMRKGAGEKCHGECFAPLIQMVERKVSAEVQSMWTIENNKWMTFSGGFSHFWPNSLKCTVSSTKSTADSIDVTLTQN